VVATTEPRRWFDLGTLLRTAGADLRYHAALPGLLVGAGLFVTFLGLAAALSAAGEVVAEGVDQATRNRALRDLLGSASVKFVTSLAGLGLSIAYALYRKRRLKAVEAAMSDFLSALQERLPLKTQAALQAEANAILTKQYADVQRIGSEFFVNLGSTLEREFDAGLQQHIKPLADAIEKLSSGLANQNEDALESMLKSFLEKLEGAVGGSRIWTHKNGNSPNAARQELDFIFVSEELSNEVSTVGGGINEFPDAWDMSDHAPVVVDFG
jgi:hypothetical protein